MRIIIVEDEPRIREGIVKLIEKHTEHEVIAALYCAETALPIISREEPELVISDIRMDKVDGLRMIEQIRALGLPTEFILLTGYADFEYACRAIQVNVVDYLLKPLTVEGMLSSLAKVEKKLATQNETSALHIEQQMEMLLNRLLTGAEADLDELRYAIEVHYNSKTSVEHSLLYIHLLSVDQESYRWVANQLRTNLNNIVIERVKILDVSGGFVCLFFDSKHNEHLNRMLERYVLKPIRDVVRCLGSLCRFNGIENMYSAFNKAYENLTYQLLCPDTSIVDATILEQQDFVALQYPSEIEEELKLIITSRQYQELHSLRTHVSKWLDAGIYRPDEIKSHCSHILCSLCVLAEEIDPHLLGRFDYREIVNQIEQSYYASDLLNVVETTIRLFGRQVGDREQFPNLLISRAIEEIADCFAENITMTGVAEKLNITPEYLSGLFAKEMGINFSTFLRNFRLSHAKRLLQQSDHRIHEIASACGFKDPQYFSRIFKEVFGMSPNEYRKEVRREPLDVDSLDLASPRTKL